nr:MAG TPA: hypothetical protein [Caudoviricetes sp.]
MKIFNFRPLLLQLLTLSSTAASHSSRQWSAQQ